MDPIVNVPVTVKLPPQVTFKYPGVGEGVPKVRLINEVFVHVKIIVLDWVVTTLLKEIVPAVNPLPDKLMVELPALNVRLFTAPQLKLLETVNVDPLRLIVLVFELLDENVDTDKL